MNRVERRKGFTLVEMVITMTLLAIFFASSIVVLGSFTRVYYRVQELNRALLIGDTILQSVEEQLKAAIRINDIYDVDASENDQVILFTDSDGMFRLFDTRGGSRRILDYWGNLSEPIDTTKGQLWLSYFHTTPPDLSDEMTYTTTKGVEQIMSSSFYKNNQIKLSFQPPEDETGSNKVQYMEITVEVWLSERLVAKTKGVIQMQYQPVIS